MHMRGVLLVSTQSFNTRGCLLEVIIHYYFTKSRDDMNDIILDWYFGIIFYIFVNKSFVLKFLFE